MTNKYVMWLTAVIVTAGTALAVGAAPAVATPAGEYAIFAQCPYNNPEVEGCLVSRTESGEVKLGDSTVPIVRTQTLQGGLINEEPIGKMLVAARNGETLSKTPQKVPGGLAGLVKCDEITGSGLAEITERVLCETLFENGVTGVNATTELAAPASAVHLNELALKNEEGVALTLPIKVKLENPLLGSECYIGSNAHPITLELTTGTSGTLKGKAGTFNDEAEGGIVENSGNTLVESNFAAPGVTGCGPLGLLDGIINAKLELPASTGNKAVLNNTNFQANAEIVAEHES